MDTIIAEFWTVPEAAEQLGTDAVALQRMLEKVHRDIGGVVIRRTPNPGVREFFLIPSLALGPLRKMLGITVAEEPDRPYEVPLPRHAVPGPNSDPRPCGVCAKTFKPMRNAVTCSPACSKAWAREQNRLRDRNRYARAKAKAEQDDPVQSEAFRRHRHPPKGTTHKGL